MYGVGEQTIGYKWGVLNAYVLKHNYGFYRTGGRNELRPADHLPLGHQEGSRCAAGADRHRQLAPEADRSTGSVQDVHGQDT